MCPNSGSPDFERPPVVETVLGLEFEPLESWGIPHFGLYWAELRNEFAKFEIQPPLGSVIEQFGGQLVGPPQAQVQFSVEPPSPRCWFMNQAGTRLLQVQDNRFLQNWRQQDGVEPYPRYRNLRPSFEREWGRFCAFLKSQSIQLPRIVQCEVTYVNHIERGQLWRSFDELGRLLRPWADSWPGSFLPAPESALINLRFGIPDNRGRLHVHLRHAIRHGDAMEILQLNLTARGAPRSSDISDILDWFDLGREWIVRGFADITTDEAHKVWGRRS